MKTFKVGSKGPQVRKIQEQLYKEGVKPRVKPNGEFCENTEKAIKAFQKKHRIKITGIADRETLFMLTDAQRAEREKAAAVLPELPVKDPYKATQGVEKKANQIREAAGAKLGQYERGGGDMDSKWGKALSKALSHMQDTHFKIIKTRQELKKLQDEFHKQMKKEDHKAAQKTADTVKQKMKDVLWLERECRKPMEIFVKVLKQALAEMVGAAAA